MKKGDIAIVMVVMIVIGSIVLVGGFSYDPNDRIVERAHGLWNHVVSALGL